MTTAFCPRDALERASHRGGRDGDLEVNRGLERPRLELFARATLDRSLRRVPDHRVGLLQRQAATATPIDRVLDDHGLAVRAQLQVLLRRDVITGDQPARNAMGTR